MIEDNKKMELKEAIKILENHNEWRRDKNIPNKIVIVNPTEIGKAIDKVVSDFKNLSDVSHVRKLLWDYEKEIAKPYPYDEDKVNYKINHYLKSNNCG